MSACSAVLSSGHRSSNIRLIPADGSRFVRNLEEEPMVAGKQKTLAAAVFAFFAMATAASAQVDRHDYRNSQGPAGRGHPRRGGHTHQRHARHEAAGRVHERSRRLHRSSTCRRTPTPSRSRCPDSSRASRAASRVSPGDRQSSASFTIEVGGLTDDGRRSRPRRRCVQARSGERSFTIPTSAVENLPIANRSFTALASLAPGVTTSNGCRPAIRSASAAAATPTS